jgi:hypothetical protein
MAGGSVVEACMDGVLGVDVAELGGHVCARAPW